MKSELLSQILFEHYRSFYRANHKDFEEKEDDILSKIDEAIDELEDPSED